jgi:hypothetical protein
MPTHGEHTAPPDDPITEPIPIYRPPLHRAPRNRALLWTIASVVVGLLVVATVVVVVVATGESDSTAEPSAPDESFEFDTLSLAADSCTTGALEDDGATLIVDTEGTGLGSGDATISDLFCVLGTLSVPSYVTAQMENTRALDGMQRAEWTVDGENFTASWTYHPDQGMDVIIRHLGDSR